jgi:hypothetical protein
MNADLQQNNFFVVEDFLHPIAADFVAQDFKKQCINSFAKADPQVAGSPALYNSQVVNQLLISKIFYMNDLVGERLYPTYGYGRWYKKGAELKPHLDASVCEVSVSINLAGDEWPIFFTKPDGTQASVSLKPGDAVIYKGSKSYHWRERFEGTECIQVFLHYITINGPNYLHAFDLQRNPQGPI